MIPVPKQKRVGRFIGGVKELLGRVTFYISLLNFLMLAVTSYYTTIQHIVQIPFWTFFAMLMTVVLAAMILEYTIILPSQIAFLNWQVYTHDNPIRRDLEKIMSKLEEIEKKLNEEDE